MKLIQYLLILLYLSLSVYTLYSEDFGRRKLLHRDICDDCPTPNFTMPTYQRFDKENEICLGDYVSLSTPAYCTPHYHWVIACTSTMSSAMCSHSWTTNEENPCFILKNSHLAYLSIYYNEGCATITHNIYVIAR